MAMRRKNKTATTTGGVTSSSVFSRTKVRVPLSIQALYIETNRAENEDVSVKSLDSSATMTKAKKSILKGSSMASTASGNEAMKKKLQVSFVFY